MNYRVGKKVFETEQEAMSFCKALNAYGCCAGWSETSDDVTHIHLGEGMTQEVER